MLHDMTFLVAVYGLLLWVVIWAAEILWRWWNR